MNQKLYDILMQLPKENLINMAWMALDEMQGYNGRTRQSCILLALGAIGDENDRYKLPSVANAKKATENMGL